MYSEVHPAGEPPVFSKYFSDPYDLQLSESNRAVEEAGYSISRIIRVYAIDVAMPQSDIDLIFNSPALGYIDVYRTK